MGDLTGRQTERLARALEIREFATRELGLPDNGSYRAYADLGRPYVVWNVFAAPEFSVEPRKSCFPVVGCVSYRGYYAQADADAFAAGLGAAGYDVFVYGVPAASGAPGEKDVVAAIVPAPGVRLDPAKVYDACRRSLEPNFVPGYLQIVEEIPKTASEKPQERFLLERFDPSARNVHRQPRD